LNKQRYIALLQDPSALTKADIPDIEELITQFPYCQNAHILLAKIQNELGSMHAAKLTRKAALYTSDRTKLKRLLAPKSVVKNNFTEEKVTSLLPEETQTPVESPTTSSIKTEVADIIESNTITEAPAVEIPEQITSTPTIDAPVFINIKTEADKHATNFLSELEANLKALHESKVRAANLFKEDTKKAVQHAEPTKIETKQELEIESATVVPVIETIPVVETVAEVHSIENALVDVEIIEPEKAPEVKPTEDKDFFSTLEDTPKTEESAKKSYSALIEAETQTKDLSKGNDVLDLILSFDNRVKDYFDINEYASKSVIDTTPVEPTVPESITPSDDTFYKLPFGNSDWNLEESRLEEQGQNSSGLLLNYLEYLKEQKNKKQKPDKKREKTIISRFIQKDPMISPLTYSESHSEDDNSNETSNNQAKPTFVSETFARMLEKQGKIQKAIAVYEELILKNPEKNSYFASLIQELKKKL